MSGWWYQQAKQSAREQNRTRTIETKVVGVTFNNRQSVVAQLRLGETLFLRRDPTNPYDRNAIQVVRQNGQQVGFISRLLAASIAPMLDRYGKPVAATVTALTGGTDGAPTRGVRITFATPEPDRAVRPQLPSLDDLDI